MTNTATNKPIQVVTPELTGSYLEVALDQLVRVQTLFAEHNVPHWAEHHAFSFNGAPPIVRIQLRRQADPRAVQQLLDSVA